MYWQPRVTILPLEYHDVGGGTLEAPNCRNTTVCVQGATFEARALTYSIDGSGVPPDTHVRPRTRHLSAPARGADRPVGSELHSSEDLPKL